jgi:hypothetical protein
MLLQLVLKVKIKILIFVFINNFNLIQIGDYGRGGVEAIRRLLYKDVCIGADLTMVNENIILFFIIKIFYLFF